MHAVGLATFAGLATSCGPAADVDLDSTDQVASAKILAGDLDVKGRIHRGKEVGPFLDSPRAPARSIALIYHELPGKDVRITVKGSPGTDPYAVLFTVHGIPLRSTLVTRASNEVILDVFGLPDLRVPCDPTCGYYLVFGNRTGHSGQFSVRVEPRTPADDCGPSGAFRAALGPCPIHARASLPTSSIMLRDAETPGVSKVRGRVPVPTSVGCLFDSEGDRVKVRCGGPVGPLRPGATPVDGEWIPYAPADRVSAEGYVESGGTFAIGARRKALEPDAFEDLTVYGSVLPNGHLRISSYEAVYRHVPTGRRERYHFSCTGAVCPEAGISQVAPGPTGTCGNGRLEAGEECDGTNMGQLSCRAFGYTSGAITCDSTCVADLSACVGP